MKPNHQSKPALIDRIRQINGSARKEWLDGFDAGALHLYLQHLRQGTGPRPSRGWVRRGDTPAIVTRRALS